MRLERWAEAANEGPCKQCFVPTTVRCNGRSLNVGVRGPELSLKKVPLATLKRLDCRKPEWMF